MLLTSVKHFDFKFIFHLIFILFSVCHPQNKKKEKNPPKKEKKEKLHALKRAFT